MEDNYIDCKCKKGCCEGLAKETVLKLRAPFEALKRDEQYKFLANLMENKDVTVRRKNRLTDARQKTTKYIIEYDDVAHEVCRVAFALILGITQKKITIVRNKIEASELHSKSGKHSKRGISAGSIKETIKKEIDFNDSLDQTNENSKLPYNLHNRVLSREERTSSNDTESESEKKNNPFEEPEESVLKETINENSKRENKKRKNKEESKIKELAKKAKKHKKSHGEPSTLNDYHSGRNNILTGSLELRKVNNWEKSSKKAKKNKKKRIEEKNTLGLENTPSKMDKTPEDKDNNILEEIQGETNEYNSEKSPEKAKKHKKNRVKNDSFSLETSPSKMVKTPEDKHYKDNNIIEEIQGETNEYNSEKSPEKAKKYKKNRVKDDSFSLETSPSKMVKTPEDKNDRYNNILEDIQGETKEYNSEKSPKKAKKHKKNRVKDDSFSLETSSSKMVQTPEDKDSNNILFGETNAYNTERSPYKHKKKMKSVELINLQSLNKDKKKSIFIENLKLTPIVERLSKSFKKNIKTVNYKNNRTSIT